ncbi:MAG: transcriptional regulator [Thermoprotei archaeon]|nr:transcriptional regulator [Thermoprotei archaeon]
MSPLHEEREEIIEEVRRVLIRDGYETKICEAVSSSCFDVVAKKNERLLLIKILVNIDNYTRDQARDLKKITRTLTAIPLLIGLRTRRSELIEGVIHERFGVKVVGLDTFRNALRDEKPLAYVKRGGMYVKIDGERLRMARMRLGLSLGELAQIIGVTRKTIYEYENGNMYATLDVAWKLEEVLGEELIRPLSLFEEPKGNDENERIANGVEGIAKKVKTRLRMLGLKAEALKRAPFNIVATNDVKYLRMIAEAKRKIEEIKYIKLREVRELAEVMRAKALVMVEKESNIEDVEGIPVINISELTRKRIPEILMEEYP